jgi:kinetochore protein Spc7/SPC105
VSPPKEIPAHRPRTQLRGAPAAAQPSSIFQPPPPQATVPLRTEEEQQRRAEILAQRAARRQSLGNRRVSFAPEATLHTWDVVDSYRGDGDSTPGSSAGGSSRASTPATASTPASNRRRSSGSVPDFPVTPTPGTAEAPSTPEHAGHDSPATPPSSFNNPDDNILSSSPLSSTAGDEGDDSAFVEDDGGHSDSTDSMDEDENVGDRTFVSAAGETTMGEGELTFTKMDMDDMDIDDEAPRQPMFKKPMRWTFEGATEDVEASSPPRHEAPAPEMEEDDDDAEEMTMDVTRVVGGLLSTSNIPRPTFSFSPKTPQKDVDDDEEMPMDMTRPIGGLLTARPTLVKSPEQEEEESFMDFTRPVGGILSTVNNSEGLDTPQAAEVDDQTMAMDITRPIGGILSNMTQRLKQTMGFGVPQTPAKQDDEEEDEMDVMMDMDITRAIGGIVSAAPSSAQNQLEPPSPTPTTTSEVEMNEDMTMEFTSVLGGIISQAPGGNGRRSSLARRRGGGLMSGEDWARDQAEKQALANSQPEEEVEMDMTMAVGGIIPATTAKAPSETASYPPLPMVGQDDSDEELDEEDFPMDLTVNLGKIFQNRVNPKDEPTPKPSPKQNNPQATAPEEAVIEKTAPPVEQKASPASLAPEAPLAAPTVASPQVDSPTPVNRRATRRSSGASVTTPRVTRGAHRRSLELQQQDLATKQSPAKVASPEQPATPVPTRPTQKSRTPQQKPSPTQEPVATPQAQVATPQNPSTPKPVPEAAKSTPMMSSAKPKTPSKRAANLSTPRKSTTRSTRSTRSTPMRFTSQSTPITTPLKGLGFDKLGLGSPAIVSKLSRRTSLNEDTMAFSPVALPSALLATARQDAEKRELREKEEKKRREEEEKMMDLMSRIQLLTPKKRGGRMSVAVGSMIPGKRALENAEGSQAKRRKSSDGIPSIVKEEQDENMSEIPSGSPLLSGSAKATPKKATPKKETPKKDTPEKVTPKEVTPQKAVPQKSPEQTPMDIEPSSPRPQIRAVNFGDDQVMNDVDVKGGEEEDGDYENISMQEFLEIIDISFLDDLKATAKRRHTGFAPASRRLHDDQEATLEERINAGAATAPMLNAYQHCCQALERYISDGRALIQELEDMVQDDNPLLFKEYIEAPADIRHIMDVQFKQIKTHARLEAKKVWYQWRMEILNNVKNMLESNLKDLKQDEQTIEQHKQQFGPFLPEIKQSWDKTKRELQQLEEMERRIGMDDQDALKTARSQLGELMGRIETARAQTQEKRQHAEKVDSELKEKEAKKAELVASIEEVERIGEMNRGWSENEVNTWKTRCEELEKKSGWTITKALPDGRLEMLYKRELKLLCDPEGKVAPVVELVRKDTTDPATAFLINDLNASISTVRDSKVLLRKIHDYWTTGSDIMANIRRLRARHYTEPRVADDGNLHVKATVLVEELRSKMEISFVVGKQNLECQGVNVRVAYGAISQQAVQDMLADWAGQWREGVTEVVEKCLADKRRGGVAVSVKG